MNQKCSKMTFTSVCVLCVLVTGGALTFWLWPRGDDMETKLETNGTDNKIETSEKKEVSLFHIEELSSAQTSSNIMTLIGFTIIFFAIGYAIFHIRFIKGSRRARKDKESMMHRLTDMEEVMLEMGYLKKKRNLKKQKKTKTQNVTRKKIKTKTRKSTIEDSVEEESDI